MTAGIAKEKTLWRLIVVGGHTRSIGKTQLVCDVIRAFPRTEWIAGKITQYGHGVCARNGQDCDCAPDEHVCALDWETQRDAGTDSARFLEAGALRSFWLRTKQGYLAEGLPLLRGALREVANGEWGLASQEGKPQDPPARTEGGAPGGSSLAEPRADPQGLKPDGLLDEMPEIKLRPPVPSQKVVPLRNLMPAQDVERNVRAVIVESNSLMQFVRPSLYFAVIDPLKEDFKKSAQLALDRASALVMRGEVKAEVSPAPLWMRLPEQLMREKPSVLQRGGEKLPEPLLELVHRMLEGPPGAAVY